MSWSQIYLRGARRLADRKTYVLLLVGILAGGLPPAALALMAVRDVESAAVLFVISMIWLWVVIILTWGSLNVAATEQPRHRTAADVIRATWKLGLSFLGAAVMLALIAIAAVLGLTLLALIGSGGTSTAPILAVLTPVFLLVGGIGYLAFILVSRLAFATIALENAGAVPSIRRAVVLVRRRTAEALLWVAGDAAIAAGVMSAIVWPVLTGAGAALVIEAVLSADAFEQIGSGEIDAGSVLFGAAVSVIVMGTFLLLVFGALAAFSAGSAVGLCVALQPAARRDPVPPVGASSFCDQCGERKAVDATFCDLCGATLALA